MGNLFSMKQSMRRLVADGGDGGFQSNLSTFGYLCVCLNAIFFGYILITDLSIRQLVWFSHLTDEDSYIENLTAILLFLAGLLLVIVASTERRIFPRCIYVLGCVAFMFAAGEEISWGQRIFDFETPENLMNLNEQNEFNIHNMRINQYSVPRIFDAIYINGTFVFCIIICAAFFCNKKAFFRIPLPSIPLMLSFLVMLSHRPPYRHTFTMEKELLLIFIIYTLFSNKISLTIYTTATMILVLVVPYIYHHDNIYMYNEEVREFLFSLCYFFYSLELLQAQRHAVRNSLELENKTHDYTIFGLSRINLVYMIGICVISGSVFLAFLKYTRPETVLHQQQETLQFLKDDDPIIRSNFDIYLNMKRRSLIYVRDNCGSRDINMKFVLRIYPLQQSDLPRFRRQYGFGNFNFHFRRMDGFFDGRRCIVIRYLPVYDIAKITTGQVVKGRKIWSGTFTFMQI